MPVDTSMYGGGVTPLDPVGTLGKITAIQNATNANKLFEQTFKARQALGPIYQSAIDPNTGELDTNKLLTEAAKNPDAAFMAGDLAQQALARKQSQVAIQGSEIDNALKRVNAINGAVSTLLPLGQNVTQQDVIGKIGDLVSQGVMDVKTAAGAVQNLPADGAALHVWLQQKALQGMDAATRLTATYGTPQAINTGAQTQIVSASPMFGTTNRLGVLNNTLSPEAATQPTNVLVRNPDGTMTPSVIRRDQFATAANQGPVATAPALTANGLTPSAATTPTQVFKDGQPGIVTKDQFVTASKGGIVPTGPKLGQEAAANVSSTQSATQASELQRTADAVPQRKAALQNLESDLQNFTSGPGADWAKFAAAATNRSTQTLFGKSVFDQQSIASQEAFTKQATQLAQAQMTALGPGSDAKLESAFHANPNEALSKMGNQQIIQLLKGNEDAITAKNAAWQKWQAAGHGPESYGQFSADFNKSYDPRVFQAQYMSKAQKDDMLKAMNPQERQQFRANVAHALNEGWVKVPQAPAPAQVPVGQ